MDYTEAVNNFVNLVQKRSDEYYKESLPSLEKPKYVARFGKRYVKVVRENPDSVYCFIDSNGDILKAAGWNTPARVPRGSIFNDNPLRGTNVYGADYLR